MISSNFIHRLPGRFLAVLVTFCSTTLCWAAETDGSPPQLLPKVKRPITIQKRYLNFPIKNGAPKRKVTMLVDGRAEVGNDMELANADPDWWAFMDVNAWRGKTVTIEVDKLPEDSAALSAVEQSDSIKGSEDLYRE